MRSAIFVASMYIGDSIVTAMELYSGRQYTAMSDNAGKVLNFILFLFIVLDVIELNGRNE